MRAILCKRRLFFLIHNGEQEDKANCHRNSLWHLVTIKAIKFGTVSGTKAGNRDEDDLLKSMQLFTEKKIQANEFIAISTELSIKFYESSDQQF